MQNTDYQCDATVGLKRSNVAPALFYKDILPFST